MKTSIIIKGHGINSKFTLLNACMTPFCEVRNLMFHNFELMFNTKKEATEALKAAYQYLKSDKEDWINSIGFYCRNISLNYDAGCAEITRTE